MVSLTIDNRNVTVPEGTTIMEAAKAADITIPSLCYLKGLNEIGACRICVVEIEGITRLVPACVNVVSEGMVVHTNSARVRSARRTNLRLIMSQHDCRCAVCIRSGNCNLQKLANDLNLFYLPYPTKIPEKRWGYDAPLIRDESKCIKCMRCIQICDKVQGMHVWDVSGTGSRTTVDVSLNRSITEADCAYCGQCVTHCPTAALSARDDTEAVFQALNDPEITTVLQIAPAVRTAWMESFDLAPEKATVRHLVAALKAMGFDYVFDTNFSADLTIMEEGSEFLERFTHRESYAWPMFTSCCPGWVRFLKSQYPEYTDQLSTAKSPQQMFGAVAKSYFAEKVGVDPHRMRVISVMPCVAKKSECAIESMNDACGDPDVDIVITTRELVRMMRSEHINPECLEPQNFDSPLGTSTGAAVVFGATGGVMDAALRSAYYLVAGKNPDPDSFVQVRGMDGWKEAVFYIPGAGDIHVAVVSGLGNTRKLMEAIEKGRVSYDFVEVMACPGGCAGGGGQPIHDGCELAGRRGEVLWRLDSQSSLRFSHENPDVQALYQDYLQVPLSHEAHHLLHTDHHSWEMPLKPTR